MLIAHRNGMAVWTNPYVTDGLVAMWDGEWNAGGGVHDANATVWKDLSGNEYDFGIPSTGVSWSDDSISLANTSLNCQLPDVSRQSFTIECTASGTGNDGAFVWMKNPSWIGGALLSWQAAGICYYPWTEIGSIGDKSLHSVSLSWGATKQILVKDGIAVVSTTGTIDVRNVLSQIFIGEYNGAKMTTMNAYCIRLYSRALATAEIAANYAIDKARFNLP